MYCWGLDRIALIEELDEQVLLEQALIAVPENKRTVGLVGDFAQLVHADVAVSRSLLQSQIGLVLDGDVLHDVKSPPF